MNTKAKHVRYISHENSSLYDNQRVKKEITKGHIGSQCKIINSIQIITCSVIFLLCLPVVFARLMHCRILNGQYILSVTRFNIRKEKIIVFQTIKGSNIDYIGMLINLLLCKVNLVGSTMFTQNIVKDINVLKLIGSKGLSLQQV